ncbi:MAG: hypothetical protein ACPLXL_01000 [Minisyncoccia bacterium]
MKVAYDNFDIIKEIINFRNLLEYLGKELPHNQDIENTLETLKKETKNLQKQILKLS